MTIIDSFPGTNIPIGALVEEWEEEEAREQQPVLAYQCWCDGACSGNPGPGGFAYLIQSNVIADELWSGHRVWTTNNAMELTAVVSAMERCVKLHATSVQIISDSSYVIDGMITGRREWKKNGWKTRDGVTIANLELWQSVDAHVGYFPEVTALWVKGHAGIPQNEQVHLLAQSRVLR